MITGTVSTISDDDFARSFRVFVSTLDETFVKNASRTFEPSKWSSRNMIQRLLERDISKHFGECKIILHVILCACVKVSVESVVESIVSRYEKHFNPSRQPDEEQGLNEMIIAENGPFLHEADGIIERAMDHYWKENTTTGKWHFPRVTG